MGEVDGVEDRDAERGEHHKRERQLERVSERAREAGRQII